MAVGDTVSDIQVIATGNGLTFQPAVGVECLITSWGQIQASVALQLSDGVNNASILDGSGVKDPKCKIFINNTNYLRIQNATGGNKNLSYSGIQTK